MNILCFKGIEMLGISINTKKKQVYIVDYNEVEKENEKIRGFKVDL
jgi:hypothetical protein